MSRGKRSSAFLDDGFYTCADFVHRIILTPVEKIGTQSADEHLDEVCKSASQISEQITMHS
jgi:hypothetical protein